MRPDKSMITRSDISGGLLSATLILYSSVIISGALNSSATGS
jgi:hypothetical protein